MFFDVDENVVPKVSKLYDLYWVVLRQSVSFYSLDIFVILCDRMKLRAMFQI